MIATIGRLLIAIAAVGVLSIDDWSGTMQLYWHCEYCGQHESAGPEYAHGDHEPCTCGHGVARVMTLREGAKIEAEIARGERVPRSAYQR